MRSDREKLIELLKGDLPYRSNEVAYWSDEHIGALADHLLANGVTFATDNHVGGKWIPVTERLPEKDGVYIVTACDEGCPYGEGIWYDTVVVMADYYDDGRWVWYEGATEYDLCDFVTHWMPLPEPPMRKGENG